MSSGTGDRPFLLGQRPSLDGWRAIACLLVLVTHVVSLDYAGTGAVGVTMFFALSGFLITRLLLEEWDARGELSVRSFYLRRALRLLPALAIVVVFAGAVLAYGDDPTAEVWFAALYVGNFAEAAGVLRSYMGHTWTLGVEEQFYLLWPLVLLFVLRHRTRTAATALVAAGVLVSVGTRIVWGNTNRPPGHVYSLGAFWDGAVGRSDAILWGCLLALVVDHLVRIDRRVTRTGAGVGIVVLAIACLQTNTETLQELWLTVAPIASVAVLLYLVGATEGPLHRVLTQRPLPYIGRISYGLYLWHVPVIVFLRPRIGGWPGALQVATMTALSFVAAIVSYSLVEARFLHLKARIAPTGRSMAPVPVSPAT